MSLYVKGLQSTGQPSQHRCPAEACARIQPPLGTGRLLGFNLQGPEILQGLGFRV